MISIYSVSCVFQGLVENKVINTASPIMMFPLMSTVKPEPKPSFKLVSKSSVIAINSTMDLHNEHFLMGRSFPSDHDLLT